MANVHGFGNINQNDNSGTGRERHIHRFQGRGHNNYNADDGNEQGFGGFMPNQPLTFENIRLANQHKVLFVSGSSAVKDPRDENYWNMLMYSLCPNFSFLSITFLVIVVDLIMFIVEVAKGLEKSSENLLQVSTLTLVQLGANYQPNDLAGQVYRFLAPIFLHVNFLHIFGNILATFLFLSRVQHTFGHVRTLIIYLLSGITANVFSVLVAKQGVKAGASTSLYGIIGVIVGYILINWKGLDLLGQILKCQVWCSALMIILFIIVFTPSQVDGRTDWFGHLGGFLAGLFISSIGTTILDNTRERVWRVVLGSLFFIMVLVCFLVFYLTQEPYASVI